MGFGGPHILSMLTEVATRALKAVWYQKWSVHRRLRPEVYAGRVHNHKTGAASYPVPYAGPALTAGHELDKVAANVAIGRNAAGVHWRSDYTESLRLGEAVALSVLEEQKACYNQTFHWKVTKFDGTTVTL